MSTAPSGTSSAPRRRAPHRAWYAAGAGLLLLAAVSGAVLLYLSIRSFTDVAATVPVDGVPRVVELEPGEEAMLWVPEGAHDGQCRILDTRTGAPVALVPPGGSFRRTSEGITWVGIARFRTGSGQLQIACVGGGPAVTAGPGVQVGAAPSIPAFVGGIFAAILVPMGLGLAGMAVIVVTVVLRSQPTTRPRSTIRAGVRSTDRSRRGSAS